MIAIDREGSEHGSSKRVGHKKTKIVATIGPATEAPERIRELIKAGANVFRLNFSHGTHKGHSKVLERIREASRELDRPVAVLQDLSGPKIRITDIDGKHSQLIDNEEVILKHGPDKISTNEKIYLPTLDPTEFLKVGDLVLLADGMITLCATEPSKKGVRCKVVKGGRIRSRVGIAFPDSDINLPATTEKDFEDLTWGIENQVDYVAISFVNSAMDVLRVKDEISKQGGIASIIAKIERKSALRNIQEILNVSDGLMVARGDLGLELPLEKVPRVQKQLIEEANYRGIPVIVATQMLHSMVTSVRPTRAEVTDISTAVMTGADALMLSEETAIGENPVLAVDHLVKIAIEAEREFDFEEFKPRLKIPDTATIPDAVAYAAAAAAVKVKADAIIACTETGNSARLIAKYRPQQALYGASATDAALRRMCLFWGVLPVRFENLVEHENELEAAIRAIQRAGKIDNGARAVITSGLSARKPGSTSMLQIREMNSN